MLQKIEQTTKVIIKNCTYYIQLVLVVHSETKMFGNKTNYIM
jgi:hypothetical protein